MVRLKETPLLKYGITISAFQFLMVRLKANDAEILNLFQDISIPYGAIKRDINI